MISYTSSNFFYKDRDLVINTLEFVWKTSTSTNKNDVPKHNKHIILLDVFTQDNIYIYI